MSLELVIVVPALLAVLALLLASARQVHVSGLLETAARDGSRAATRSRTLVAADQQVRLIVQQTLAEAPASCRDSAGWSVDDPAGFVPGSYVTVRVWCTRTMTDLGLPLPSTVMTRSFTSPLDPYRGTR